MADEETPSTGSATGRGFQQQLGPLKVWQWGVIVIGSVVAIVIVRKYMGGGGGGGGGDTQAAYIPLPGANQSASSTDAISQLEQAFTDSQKKLADSIGAVAAGEQQDVQTLQASNLAGNTALQSALTKTNDSLQQQITALSSSIQGMGSQSQSGTQLQNEIVALESYITQSNNAIAALLFQEGQDSQARTLRGLQPNPPDLSQAR